jgi:hypothetical protein
MDTSNADTRPAYGLTRSAQSALRVLLMTLE